MEGELTLLIRILLLVIIQVSSTDGFGNESALRTALRTGYDADTKPELPTNVTVMYNLRLLKELDITLETFKNTGFLRLLWNDSRLTWDPVHYGNITLLSIDWAWRPQFVIGNSAGYVPRFGDDDDHSSVRLYHTGEVTWGRFFYAETICDVNTENFPFDEQTCGMELGFIYDEAYTHLNLLLATGKVDVSILVPHGEWEFIDSHMFTVDFPLCCPAMTAIAVRTDMTFRRRQPYYVINVILPMIFLSFCVPWVFFIPTESGERLGYSLTMLLSYFVFITVTSEMIPSTSIKIPILAEYLLTVLALCVFALISVAIQVKVTFMETHPNRVAKVILKVLRAVVKLECCKKPHNSTTPIRIVPEDDCKRAPPDEEEFTSTSGSTGSNEELEDWITWKCFAVVVDRFLFYLYNVIVIICNMALLVTLYG